MRIPRIPKKLASVFSAHGYQCYLVGGATRNIVLKRKIIDFDIATDARPEQVSRIFKRVIPTGIKHGTVTVLFQGKQFEVTTFRSEGEYLDGRRPSTVTFTPSIHEDLKRRDFTINAIAWDLINNRLLDPHNGRRDIKLKTIRAIGDPVERFSEDGLRPLRACRLATQLDFQVEKETLGAIGRTLHTVAKVSQERIRDELERILKAHQPSIGFKLMLETALLFEILPELAACKQVEQRELHCFDVFHHSIYTADAAPQDNLVLRLAALLHDIGKAVTISTNHQGQLQFHGHEKSSALLAGRITRRLKFPNLVTKRVTHLVLHHMFNYQEEWSDAAVRRFISRVGRENIPDLLALRRADQIGRCRHWEISPALIDFEKRIEKVLAADQALTISDLKLDGRDIISSLELAPGPQIGVILKFLLESVLEDPDLNTRPALLRLAHGFYKERLKDL
jgi:poly(A) polymerase/tRNA nucleotidyltransferase (CCA-adding enzyme)